MSFFHAMNSLYNIIIKNTFSNTIVHIILIIIDYLFTMYPFIISTPYKLYSNSFEEQYTPSPLESSLPLFTRIKLLTTNQTSDDYSSIYLLLIIIILIILLIIYYLILLFHKSNNVCMFILSKFTVNIYNLFVFRYFSFCFIDAISYYFLFLIHFNNTYYKSILSFLLLGIQCIYLLSVFWFINNFTVYIYVSNKKIVPYNIKYPFDYHSLIYEKFTFIMKIFIAYDNNYIIINGNRISQINIFLNICIFSITFISIIAYIINEIYGKDYALVMFTNRKLNAIRKIILIITFISIIIGITFRPRKNLNEELLISFVSVLMSIAFYFMISKYTRKQTLYIRWKDNLEGIILLLMTKNISNTSFTQGNFSLSKNDNVFKNTTTDKNNNIHSEQEESENQKRKYTKIAKRLKVHHFINCQHHSTCKVCSKKGVIHNTLISKENENDWYSELYYLYKENKMMMNVYDSSNSKHAKYSSKKYMFYLIKLFLSKINQKTFFFFKYFYTLTEDKYISGPSLLKNNLHFLFSNEEVIEDPGTHVFLQEMLTLSRFNVHLKNLLVNFLSFINQEQNLKTADQLLQLSKNIASMKDELEHIIKLLDAKQYGLNGNSANNNNNNNSFNSSKDPTVTKDQATKNIQSSCKYNLTLSRYILETLINRSFNSLNPLNIELYEDYLTMHFHFDKVMILSTYIKGNIKQGNRCIFDTIKITGFSSNSNIIQSNFFGTTNGLPKGFYTLLPGTANAQAMSIEDNTNQEEGYSQFTFSELFPKNLQELAEIRLHELVVNYKGNDIGVFEFVIENHKYLQYIKYIFSLSNTLIDDKLMIYGYFTSPYERIVLIKYNNIFYEQDDMYYHGEIVSYSNIMGQIFIIKPYLYEIVKNNLNKTIVLSDIFITINFCGSKEIMCELNYEYLNKNCFYLFDKLLQIKASTNEKANTLETDINKMKEIIKDRMKRTLYMRFSKIIEIDASYVVYNVSFFNKNGKLPNSFIKNNQIKEMNFRTTKRNLTRENNETFEDEENKNIINENNFIRDLNMQTISSLSITENTMSDHVSSLQSSNKSSQKENSPAKIIIQKETKKLQIVSLITFIINLCLICLCFIFLIIQILKTNEIKHVNDLNLEFKTLRLIFTNIVSSITKSICIVPSITDNTCINFYGEYISNYQYNTINFTKYDINDYLFYELTNKANYFKNTYSDFKKQLYELGSSDFLNILNTEVVYISFEQKTNQLLQRTINDVFGNAIITYINSILVLVGEKENNEMMDFRNENIYLLTLHNRTVNFDNILNQQLSQLQHELYKLFSNFINFFVAFNIGESIIDNKVNSLRNETIAISYIFMIALMIFNVLLTFMNIENFRIASTLFCKMIGNVFIRLDKSDLKDYLNKKINYLITLSDLYAKSPIQIIKKITYEHSLFVKTYFQNKKNTTKSINSSNATINNMSSTPFNNSLSLFQDNDKEDITNLNNSEDLLIKNNKLLSLHTNSFQIKVFFNKTVTPLKNRNIFFSLIYFVIIIICDVVLVCYYYDVFQYQDFVMCNLNFELYLYDSIAISSLYRLLNMSDHHMMNILEEAPDEDGMVNKFLKKTFSFYKDVLNYQQISTFSDINGYLPLNCKELYIKANDSYTYGYYQLKGIDFDKGESFEEMFCEEQGLLKESLFFPMENYILMLMNLHNEHNGKTYETSLKFFNDDDLYRSFMILDFYIRIVRKYLTLGVIMPKLRSKFTFYLKYVWVYLILNIVMEICFFVFSNLLIKKQLEHIKAELILFDNCVR